MPLMKHIRSTPREALNWRLFLTIFVVGLAGLGRGTDEGLIGSLTGSKEWLNEFKVANGSGAQSNVVSMVQLGNIPGALLAFFAVDRIGRLNTIRVCALIWILGIAIWITSAGSLGQTYGGRFVAGIGIGAFSVVCPTYLSEISPRTIRGLAVTVFSAMVYLGITLSYFANYGAQSGFPKQSTKVWRVPVGMNFVYAGLLFLGTFLIKESPRALVKRGKAEEALETLAWYRNLPRDHPYLRDEFNGIMEENHREAQAMEGHTYWTVFKHLFTRSANLYRLIVIGFGIQILGQWSGGGSLTIYAQKIFVLVGVKTNASLYTTGIFGVVKLTSGLCCAFFLVDLLGRKRSVFIGIGLQTLAALYLAVFLSTVNPSANAAQSATQERASIAAIVMIFISGVGWALGFNTIQYLIGTEIWPMELRAMASSLIMCVHFANQYGSSRAIQPMLTALDRWGLFAFWTCIGVIAAIYIFVFIPETSGRSLESMDELFEQRWWRIGMASKKPIGGDLEGNGREKVPEEMARAQQQQLPALGGNNNVARGDDEGKDAKDMQEKGGNGFTSLSTRDAA